MSAPSSVTIHPQAALNEYASLKAYYENRTMLLAQQVHELTSTVEVLRQNLADAESALAAELEPKPMVLSPVSPVTPVVPTPPAEPASGVPA
jgi:hypothetical protein